MILSWITNFINKRMSFVPLVVHIQDMVSKYNSMTPKEKMMKNVMHMITNLKIGEVTTKVSLYKLK